MMVDLTMSQPTGSMPRHAAMTAAYDATGGREISSRDLLEIPRPGKVYTRDPNFQENAGQKD